jgi:hypothetical protein
MVSVMTSGGRRNRSGPALDPSSGRSDQRGIKLTALPSGGFDGPVPEFPLPMAATRELEVWAEAWRSPQACAWALPSESWRIRTVALWVRTTVRCEDPNAPASLLGQLHRFADQIGFTPAGMTENGWAVAADEVAVKRSAESKATESKPVRRLRAVNDGQ